MKKCLFLFLLGIFNYSHSQSSFDKSSIDGFVKKFHVIEKFPILFDQLSLENFDEYKLKENRLSCKEISASLIDEENEKFITANDTIFNRFYSIGRIYLSKNMQVLIFAHLSNLDAKDRVCEVLYSVIDKDKKIIAFSSLGYSNKTYQIATLLLKNFNFIQLNYGEIEFNANMYDEPNKSINDEYLKSYKANYDDIPISDNLDIKLSRDKVESLKNLIPLNFCSPFIDRPLNIKIDEDKLKSYSSFFLGAKKIDENRKIVFVLNNLEFNEFHNVYEINYVIINKDGILKETNLATFYTDKQGRNYDTIGKIEDLEDKIILTSIFPFDSKVTEFKKSK